MKHPRNCLPKFGQMGQLLGAHDVCRPVVVLLEYETVLESLFSRKPENDRIIPKVTLPSFAACQLFCAFETIQKILAGWLPRITEVGQPVGIHRRQLGSDLSDGMEKLPAKVDRRDLVDEHSKIRLVVVAAFMIRGRF